MLKGWVIMPKPKTLLQFFSALYKGQHGNTFILNFSFQHGLELARNTEGRSPWKEPPLPWSQQPCVVPKEYIHLEGKRGGGGSFFTQIEPNWPLLYGTVPVPWLRDARPADWVTYCSICASTMPRAKNRAEKGSILLWRRLALTILLFFIYGCSPSCFVALVLVWARATFPTPFCYQIVKFFVWNLLAEM